jgi:acetyl-CoA C-acetyltransferase
MGPVLKIDAAIIGCAQHKPIKVSEALPRHHLDQIAELCVLALSDAGLAPAQIDGIVLSSTFAEASQFVPTYVAEHLGLDLKFAEIVDLGGASAIGMVARAALAVTVGMCRAVLCVLQGYPTPPGPAGPDPQWERRKLLGAHSELYGAPEAEFDLPYGHMAQNSGYAMLANRYRALHGYDERAMAKIAVDQRMNANLNPDAFFYSEGLTVDDVLSSRMIADPLRLYEVVKHVAGGAAVIVASPDIERTANLRNVLVRGVGECVSGKSPSYRADPIDIPLRKASRVAFNWAGLSPQDMDMAQIYDCYTITVLLSLEAAGFCSAGEGLRYVQDSDLTVRGSMPVNTHGGQLSFGQAGQAGGMSQVIEAVQQIRGLAGRRQLPRHDLAFVSGTGGVMAAQCAMLLEGD